MGIGQFLVVFWARRLLIFWATVSCLIGALIVTALLPPRWESTARVMLDYIKPDPVTGQVIAGMATRAYVQTQIELVTDYTVAGKVAEQVGWFSDPNLISAYQRRPSKDQRDFRHWLADIVAGNSKAKLLEGSNILEISYTANTARGAESVAGALLKGYMDASLESRHEDAERNAVWYEQQTIKAKQALDAAVTAKATYERENGIVMQDNKLDAENARLQALTQQGAPLSTPFVPTVDTSQTATQLAQTDAELGVALKTLGPNNPGILELKARRASLAEAVAKEQANMRGMQAHAAALSVGSLDRAIATQKEKVISESDKIGRLNQLQQDVELRREWYQRCNAKAAEYREQAVSADIGVRPLGTATTPKEPTFPNYLLIVPGATVLGLAVGILVSLLMELLGRRVRVADDLDFAGEAPVICVVPRAERAKGYKGPPTATRRRRRWFPLGAARA
jgi:succinoglycan biosynthesis transport protein ExoP